MELRWVTAAPSGSCADTKGPLRRPPEPRSPEKTDADGSLLTRVVRAATPAGRRSAAKACECTPPSRNSARCGSRALALRRHPHSRGVGQIVITAHCPFAGGFAAIDTAGSLPTRSVNAEPLIGHAMAARGRTISIGRGCATGRKTLARARRLYASAVAHGRCRLRGWARPRPRPCCTAKCAAAERIRDAAAGGTQRKDLPWKPLRGVGSTQPWISKCPAQSGSTMNALTEVPCRTGKPGGPLIRQQTKPGGDELGISGASAAAPCAPGCSLMSWLFWVAADDV